MSFHLLLIHSWSESRFRSYAPNISKFCLDLTRLFIGRIPIWRMKPKLISKILITPVVIIVKWKGWHSDTSCKECPQDQNNIEKGRRRNPITSSRNNRKRHSGEKNSISAYIDSLRRMIFATWKKYPIYKNIKLVLTFAFWMGLRMGRALGVARKI